MFVALHDQRTNVAIPTEPGSFKATWPSTCEARSHHVWINTYLVVLQSLNEKLTCFSCNNLLYCKWIDWTLRPDITTGSEDPAGFPNYHISVKLGHTKTERERHSTHLRLEWASFTGPSVVNALGDSPSSSSLSEWPDRLTDAHRQRDVISLRITCIHVSESDSFRSRNQVSLTGLHSKITHVYVNLQQSQNTFNETPNLY